MYTQSLAKTMALYSIVKSSKFKLQARIQILVAGDEILNYLNNYIYDSILTLIIGDSHWEEWGEWTHLYYNTNEDSYIHPGLTIATCKRHLKLRNRICVNQQLGYGDTCEGKCSSKL